MLLAATVALAACAGSAPPPRQPQFGLTPPAPLLARPTPAANAAPIRGLTLLAPLTGPNAERGRALVNAAQLALADPGSPVLDVRDTAGTPQGAAAAATAALAAGARLFIGPLTTAETAAVAPVARPAGVAVLAFTNDPTQAQPGVWTLGLTPVQQVRRLVGAAMARSKGRFAAALPNSGFGQSMATALTQAIGTTGAPAPDIHFYESTNAGISSTIRDLAGDAGRRAPPEARRKDAGNLSHPPESPASFDLLLLAEANNERLAWLTSFLAYYDITPAVQVMGPALWAVPSTRSGAELNGAWYAAPDPAARASFVAAYTAKFNTAPPGLADFAYDAAAIARVLAAEGRFSVAALCRPEGFAGVDGLFALQTDGTVRRGLALFQIGNGGPTMIEPAPDLVSAPGI